MTTPSLATTDIDALSESDADRLLRQAIAVANLNSDGEPEASAQTREALVAAVQDSGATVDQGVDGDAADADALTRQALRVLAEDPAYGQLSPDAGSARRGPTKDFAVDPLAFIGITSLALIVVNTYLKIERDADGKWTFQLSITPASEKLKLQVVELAKRLVSFLPKDGA